MTSSSCPCGQTTPIQLCCGAIIRGAIPAPTAEALMRARYTAYVLNDIDYILATHDPTTLGDLDRDSIASWAEGARWQKLEVRATERGREEDDEGIVDFIAHYEDNGIPHTVEERSLFRKIDGRWYYTDAAPEPAEAPKGKKPGRNEPCTCGSGKKYKKCCGARG